MIDSVIPGPCRSSIAARIQSCAAVVFDLDDTLYLERDYVAGGAQAAARWVAKQAGLDPARAEREVLALVQAGPADDPLGCWLALCGLGRDRWLAAMLEIYRAHPPAIELEPAVEALLHKLSGVRNLGLVTDGRAAQQRRKVEALRLERWPLSIVLSDELGRECWKPSVRPFQQVLDLLAVEPQGAVYVGDNPAKDFLGARRAGMLSVRWRRSGGLHARIEPADAEAAPDAETTSIYDLEQLLLGDARSGAAKQTRSGSAKQKRVGKS